MFYCAVWVTAVLKNHFKIIESKDFECFHHKEMINIEGMDILNTLILSFLNFCGYNFKGSIIAHHFNFSYSVNVPIVRHLGFF